MFPSNIILIQSRVEGSQSAQGVPDLIRNLQLTTGARYPGSSPERVALELHRGPAAGVCVTA